MSKKIINQLIKELCCLHEYAYRWREVGKEIYQVKECRKCGKIKILF